MNARQLNLQQIDVWLKRIEERVQEIEKSVDLSEIRPGEAEQAIARYGVLFMRLIQQRQQLTQGGGDTKEQALVEAMLGIKKELMIDDEEDEEDEENTN